VGPATAEENCTGKISSRAWCRPRCRATASCSELQGGRSPKYASSAGAALGGVTTARGGADGGLHPADSGNPPVEGRADSRPPLGVALSTWTGMPAGDLWCWASESATARRWSTRTFDHVMWLACHPLNSVRVGEGHEENRPSRRFGGIDVCDHPIVLKVRLNIGDRDRGRWAHKDPEDGRPGPSRHSTPMKIEEPLAPVSPGEAQSVICAANQCSLRLPYNFDSIATLPITKPGDGQQTETLLARRSARHSEQDSCRLSKRCLGTLLEGWVAVPTG
jgi:hypothetical protein